MVESDVRDTATLHRLARDAAAVFHLAAQVAVTTSLEDPIEDFEVNVQATVALLDALRRAGGGVPLLYASTNKVYGGLADVALEARGDAWHPVDPSLRRLGIDEGRALEFHTPYGCSKGAADQYVLDYARCFGVPTVVFRKSCIYGRRQLGTEDQGWVAHFARRALANEPVTVYGDGRQVRDVLDVHDAVGAYVAAWRRIDAVQGQALNLGGGPENAVSLREVLAEMARLVGHEIPVEHGAWRAGDQRWYVSDPRRARTALDLAPFKPWRDGLADLVSWLALEQGAPLPSARVPVHTPVQVRALA